MAKTASGGRHGPTRSAAPWLYAHRYHAWQTVTVLPCGGVAPNRA